MFLYIYCVIGRVKVYITDWELHIAADKAQRPLVTGDIEPLTERVAVVATPPRAELPGAANQYPLQDIWYILLCTVTYKNISRDFLLAHQPRPKYNRQCRLH